MFLIFLIIKAIKIEEKSFKFATADLKDDICEHNIYIKSQSYTLLENLCLTVKKHKNTQKALFSYVHIQKCICYCIYYNVWKNLLLGWKKLLFSKLSLLHRSIGKMFVCTSYKSSFSFCKQCNIHFHHFSLLPSCAPLWLRHAGVVMLHCEFVAVDWENTPDKVVTIHWKCR